MNGVVARFKNDLKMRQGTKAGYFKLYLFANGRVL